MGVDLPPITSAEIGSEFQKPQAQEVVSVGECKSPDFQKQFDELQSQTKEKTAKLQEEMQYSEKQKEILRKIYGNLGEENPELKKAIETQSVKIFEVPGRDLVALSLGGKNVDYLYDLEGNEYFDFTWRRNNEMRYLLMLETFKDYNLIEVNNNGKYLLYLKEREIESFSNEYFKLILEPVDFIIKLGLFLKDIAEEMKKEGR